MDCTNGGDGLIVAEVDAEPLAPGPANPEGNGWMAVETDMGTEESAKRAANPFKARVWKVKNPASLHPVTGLPVAYKLVPLNTPSLLAHPSSAIYARGTFAAHNLWVTPYSDFEKWPAGDYPLQSLGGAGLPTWTQQNRTVYKKDVVLWHSFGITHVVRPEDFPVMPVEVVGFVLKPVGFFSGNPSVDV